MTEAGILAERRSFVAGRWVESDEVLVVENPADESVAPRNWPQHRLPGGAVP